MTITTLSTTRHISPTIISTFFKHYFRQAKKSRSDRHLEATDELLFDEAFHVVKRFIALGTNDTVEALQAFTNTRIPSQPFTTLVPALIPLSSCDQAAACLISYFGAEDLKNIVGGERWWQVRMGEGVEGEWVAMTEDWKRAKWIEEMPDGVAQAKAAKYAKYDKRHERYTKEEGRHKKKDKRSIDRHDDAAAAAAGTSNRARTTTAANPTVRQDGIDGDDPAAIPLGDDDDEDVDGESVPVEELDRLRRVMLYLHGGGYYFGSCSTHRYQIIRLARKMGGRAFCPNYRKAPGYPWPCPLQDCLAAWFYLTDPPPGAGHKAIDPKNIVIAGDSAGGGMCLAVLGVLRDLALPMPAGAVLISPWCDMTHSFPSIMQNTDTDIIPPYGFIHKPSTLWPVPANVVESDVEDGDGEAKVDHPSFRRIPKSDQEPSPSEGDDTGATQMGEETQQEGQGQVTSTEEPSSTSEPHHDTANSSRPQTSKARSSSSSQPPLVPPAPRPLRSEPIRVELSDQPDKPIELKQQIQLYATNNQLYHPLCSPILQGSLGGLPPLYILAGDGEVLRDEVIMLAHRAARPEKYPLPEHLLEKNRHSRDTAQRFNSHPTQVHLQVFDYQCHVLTLFSFTTAARYAYRAIASFCKYVTRAETIESGGASSSLRSNPFPALAPEPSASSSVFSPVPSREEREGPAIVVEGPAPSRIDGLPRLDVTGEKLKGGLMTNSPVALTPMRDNGEPGSASSNKLPLPTGSSNRSAPTSEPHRSSLNVSTTPTSSSISAAPSTSASSTTTTTDNNHNNNNSASTSTSPAASSFRNATTPSSALPSKSERASLLAEKRRKVTLGVENDYSGQVPLLRPCYEEHMIRERVDVRGRVRPLEPEEHLPSVRLFVDHPHLVGKIREGPVRRYLAGQEIWDAKFRRTAAKVLRRRRENQVCAERMLRDAAEKGLILHRGGGREGGVKHRQTLNGKPARRSQVPNHALSPSSSSSLRSSRAPPRSSSQMDDWEEEPQRYTPLDVREAGETPPPSALAGRRDCEEALLLLLQSFPHLDSRENRRAVLAKNKKKKKSSRMGEQIFGASSERGDLENGISSSSRRGGPGGGGSTRTDMLPRRTPPSSPSPRKTRKVHGLDLWVRGMGLFGKKTRRKAFFQDDSVDVEEPTAIPIPESRPGSRPGGSRGEVIAEGVDIANTSGSGSGSGSGRAVISGKVEGEEGGRILEGKS